jgi:C-terminal processing protease CtpA/Prc
MMQGCLGQARCEAAAMRPFQLLAAVLVHVLAMLAVAQSTRPDLLEGVSASAPVRVDYGLAFRDLYDHLGRRYPCFEMKGIDWRRVGDDLLPRAAQVRTENEFGLLCLELVANLKDSHAGVLAGSAKPPQPPLPLWDPGLACLLDDRGRPVVFHVDRNSPAALGGVKVGMTVVAVDDKPAGQAMDEWMRLTSRYAGYSSDRCLRYDAARMFLRRHRRGELVRIKVEEVKGGLRSFELSAQMGVRYIPRLPVPIAGIRDSADVSWKRLQEDIGYLYVRRVRPDLPELLDRAIKELKGVHGLILDVRGNGGGGFDGLRAVRNFNVEDGTEPLRPRYAGPIAMLIDERCISAGEGWASWFVANRRARLFGSATAGASSAKETYTLSNGLYQVVFAVGARRGFLDRPIEGRGLEPDVPVRCTAADLAAGKDTVLGKARRYLIDRR